MGSTDWRLAMVVFNATDLAQHFYLKHFDKRHPHFDGGATGHGDAISEVYSRCDQFIGECMEYAAEGDVIAIASDHGCQPLTSSIAKDVLLKDVLQSSALLRIRHRRDDDRPSASADIAHRGRHADKETYASRNQECVQRALRRREGESVESARSGGVRR